MPPRYRQIASQIAEHIEQGQLNIGDKLPGVRQASEAHHVSLSTALAAYRYLEQEQYIEARPRSGFYIKARFENAVCPPSESRPDTKPTLINSQQRVMQVISAANRPGILRLGATVPDASFLPVAALERALASAARHPHARSNGYEFPPGYLGLRQQLAKRMNKLGCQLHADDITITQGCQEALYLALKVSCQAGDIVALESPLFYGLLQIIDSLGLQALEIPTDPQHGISLEALQLAIEKWPVKACIVVSNFSNPIGATLNDTRKRDLVAMLSAARIPLIEDDIYGELSFEQLRPSIAKRYDTGSDVLYCSSLSKSLSPALRIGWIAGGKYSEELNYQKFTLNAASATIPQLAAERLLRSGEYDRHLHRMRAALATSTARIREALARHMPSGTQITQPRGGYALWLELPKQIDTLLLAEQALAQNISIAAGPLFTASEKYRHCLRISCACPWNTHLEEGLATLGTLANAQCI
ncbi:MAG: DNA-binding transcriptional MocR family regulator [Zhongshania aliphaticivorans]|jgi:DNA-binding transcriptional MocR family regulator|uniref:aminotransferase-like domain-containing protein n=1 Tax=Zhongshania aliphaticivorans TaxID=1470434 RepID=UPI0039E4A5F3